MNIDASPLVIPSNIPSSVSLGRPDSVGLPSGEGAAAVTEFDRPIVELEPTQAGREQTEQQNDSENPPGRGAEELAAQLRFELAREQSSSNPQPVDDQPQGQAGSAAVEATMTADVGQLPLNDLEAQITSRFAADPVGAAEARGSFSAFV